MSISNQQTENTLIFLWYLNDSLATRVFLPIVSGALSTRRIVSDYLNTISRLESLQQFRFQTQRSERMRILIMDNAWKKGFIIKLSLVSSRPVGTLHLAVRLITILFRSSRININSYLCWFLESNDWRMGKFLHWYIRKGRTDIYHAGPQPRMLCD